METYTPIEYLKIDLANQYGLDKQQFEDRIAWVDRNQVNLEAMVEHAEDRYRFAAALIAFREVQAGKPTGHLVGLDACASGPQIMAALMRDPIGALNTSLVGSKRNCVYTKTTQVMNKILNMQKTFDRSSVKNALMPFYYGSQKEPKEAFGENTDELNAFYKAQSIVVPGASYLMPILRSSWDDYAEEHTWTLPDGFVARVKVTGMDDNKIEVDELNHATFTYRHIVIRAEEKGVANIANVVQAIDGFIVRELCRRCNYDEVQHGRVLALLKKRVNNKSFEPNPIQEDWRNQDMVSIVGLEKLCWRDVCNLDLTYCNQLIRIIERCLARPSFPVITVHDEFMAHPNYMNWVRMTYAEIMAELSDSIVIDSILSELYHKPIRVTKMSDSISDLILAGNYAIS